VAGTSYILKRLGFAVLTLFVAVTINFVLFRALPGSAVTDMSRVPNASPELVQALNHQFGLDKSKFQQYVIYLGQLAHGNMGVSYIDQRPVTSTLLTALKNTLPMAIAGTAVAIVLGLTSGIVATWRRDTLVSYGTTFSAMLLYSFPTQWLGLMLILLFGAYLPSSGMTSEFMLHATWWQSTQDYLRHLVLPSLTYALTLYGQYALVVRSAMLETMGEDYVLTARAKGLPMRRIIIRHVFRNAMLPVATLIALSLGFIVAGAVLIETVFSWPGIGRMIYLAVLSRDYPLLQGAFLVVTISVVFFNFVADLLYFKLDPRISE